MNNQGAISENSARPSRRSLAGVWAVVAGFAATFVLSVAADAGMHAAGIFPKLGQPMPESLFVLAAGYRTLFTVFGGYLTARLAPSKPMRHAMILAGIGLLAATLGTLATWNKGPEFGPKWYPISLIVLALPSVWLGARLREWVLKRKN